MRVLDHVGIAVRSVAERRDFYETLGLEMGGEETVAGQKVRVALFELEGTRIELLEPTEDSSPIAGFLAKRGEGLHHLSFQVESIDETMSRLRRAGYALLSEQPQPGAHGTRVCFVHPRSAGGVLIELTERPAGDAP